MPRLFALLLLAPAVALAADRGDWPQFRGANSDGLADVPPPPVAWAEAQHVAWKTPIPGLGWSSPAVVGDRVFLTTAVPQGDGLSLRVLALDAASGRIVWDREVRLLEKKPKIHAKNSHASPTPIVRDGAVYVHFGPHGMFRLAAADGAVQWSCLELDYPPVHGSGSSPLLHDGKLVVTCDGAKEPFVAAVDAATGKVAWKTPRSVKARMNFAFATPAITEAEGRPLVLAPGADHLAAYDLATGEEIWRVRAPGWSVVPQPAVGHGMVFYNRDYDAPELIAVRLGGRGDVTDTHVVWRERRGAPSTPSPLLVGDELYVVSDDGVASCFDAKTGQRLWMKRMGGNFSASPLHVAGRVLFLNETGVATWVKAGREYEVIGTAELPGRTLATPAITPGAVFLRTDAEVYKIAG